MNPSTKKVIVIDTCHSVLLDKLSDFGFEVDYAPEISFNSFVKIAKQYSGIILRSRFRLDKKLLFSLSNLEFIGRIGAGMESIDTTAAETRGITCFNSPEGNRDALAEHALGMLLMLFNNLHRANAQVKNGIWKREENRGLEIKEKTIGIIGFGNMGQAFAQRLKGFEANILAYDKYKSQFGTEDIIECDLDEIFNNADILSLHVPLTKETQYLFNQNFIDHFNKPIFLVNTSRGKVVNTKDLVAGLESKKILGAALDVNEYEDHSFEQFKQNKIPAALSYLQNSDRVVLSPHIAGWTHESLFKLADFLAEKIIKNISL